MHDISRKASWWFKDVTKAIKDTGLLDSSLALSLLVLNIILRRYNAVEILSVFCEVDWGEMLDVDIWVVTGWIVRAQGSK